MAVDQDLLDRVASSVADLYREVESSLTATIAHRLRVDGIDESPYQLGKLDAIQKLRRSAQVILASLQAARAGVVRQAIAAAYRNGYGSAQTDLPEQYFPKSGIGQAARQATRAVPNAAVIENIAQALHRDLGKVEGNILRAPIDAYRAVQAGAAARIVTGAETRRQAAQAVWQRLIDKGITSFTDSRGRRWKLSSYAEMITRTNAARAAVQGQTDRLDQIGVQLVIVSDHGQECKLCRPYEGKILSLGGPTGDIEVEHGTRDGVMVKVHVTATLDQARAAGLFHPNCRHSTSAYLPGVTKIPTNTADPEGDKARQRQRALERRIRAEKEKAGGALTDEANKDANRRVRAAQAALRDHLKANPKLKRLPYREQVGAGNIPRRGGPAGGPVRDLQPPVQQQLRLDGRGNPPGGQPPTPKPKPPRWDPPPRLTPSAAQRMQDDMLKGKPWTRTQREAIKEYTYGWAKSINDALRNGTKADDTTRGFTRALADSMRPSGKATTLYRYVGRDAFGLDDVTHADQLVGKTLQDRGFMSTSTMPSGHTDDAQQMAIAAMRDVRMEIDTPAGTQLAYVDAESLHPGQHEVIVMAGTKYKVIDVTRDGAQTVIRVQIVP